MDAGGSFTVREPHVDLRYPKPYHMSIDTPTRCYMTAEVGLIRRRFEQHLQEQNDILRRFMEAGAMIRPVGVTSSPQLLFKTLQIAPSGGHTKALEGGMLGAHRLSTLQTLPCRCRQSHVYYELQPTLRIVGLYVYTMDIGFHILGSYLYNACLIHVYKLKHVHSCISPHAAAGIHVQAHKSVVFVLAHTSFSRELEPYGACGIVRISQKHHGLGMSRSN